MKIITLTALDYTFSAKFNAHFVTDMQIDCRENKYWLMAINSLLSTSSPTAPPQYRLNGPPHRKLLVDDDRLELGNVSNQYTYRTRQPWFTLNSDENVREVTNIDRFHRHQ